MNISTKETESYEINNLRKNLPVNNIEQCMSKHKKHFTVALFKKVC